VDVSSRRLDARIGQDGVEESFANSTAGIALLGEFCRSHEVELVAMEATGGYEQQAFAELSQQGLPVAIVNPRSVRRFAEAMGLLEKTDRIDAGVIAWFAQTKRSCPAMLPSARQQQRRALVTRLRQLIQIRTAQRNQARLLTDPIVLGMIEELQQVVARQIRELETAIAAHIAEDPLWRQLDPVLRSIKGVAGRTVSRLMAEMPELGTLSNKAISKLAGVAPLSRDSGKQQGKRITRGGRAPVREILFIVASVAARYEPDFVAFQQRLAAAGKPPKVIRIALAHKLLVRLNAKAREVRQCMAQPSPPQTPVYSMTA
jgi:transposase